MKKKMSWVVSAMLMFSFTVAASSDMITTFLHGWGRG